MTPRINPLQPFYGDPMKPALVCSIVLTLCCSTGSFAQDFEKTKYQADSSRTLQYALLKPQKVEEGKKFKSPSGLMVETTGVTLHVDSHGMFVHEVEILDGVGLALTVNQYP